MSREKNAKAKPKKVIKQTSETIEKKTNIISEESSKSKNVPESINEYLNEKPEGPWSNDTENIDKMLNSPAINMQINRPAIENSLISDIPTVAMEEIDEDNPLDLTSKLTIPPEFSINPIVSFAEMEKDYFREHSNRYLDPTINIGILYNNIHLNEDFNAEIGKLWNWDAIFIELRNSMGNNF